jgi:hypothetical protein
MILKKEYVTDFESLSEAEVESMLWDAKRFSIDSFLKANPKLTRALIAILEVISVFPFIGKGWKVACMILLTALKSIEK